MPDDPKPDTAPDSQDSRDASVLAAQRAAAVAQEAAAVALKAAEAVRAAAGDGKPDEAKKDEGKKDKENEEKKAPKKRPPWLKPVLLCVLAVLILFGIAWGVRFWKYSHTHVSTDDAYVTGNLTNVAPIVSGTLQQLYVDEGSFSKRGQLLAKLDSSGPLASLRAAQAAYRAALSQIPQAERNLAFQRRSTDAAVNHAQAALSAQKARAQAARQQVSVTSNTTRNQVKQALEQVNEAGAQYDQSLAKVRSAAATVDNYRQQILTAQKAVDGADARVRSARSDLDRATRSEERARVLYQEDAVAAQDYDNAHAQALSAQGTLQSNVAAAQEARSQVEQVRKSVQQAQADAVSAQRAADAAKKQIGVQEAGLGVARANLGQVNIDVANLDSADYQAGQSVADIATAEAGQEQISVRMKQIDTYRAEAAQAQAAVTNAQILLNDANIYAPSDGIVVRKAVDVGASLSPGQTILTMSQGEYSWVDANFKETQLNDVVPGEPVEIEVDAFPGKVFKGVVKSINQASGAATSLLPPDNATGNFTKVVQRISVRIEFVAAKEDEDKQYARAADILDLRQGMSVVATIDTSDVDKYRAEYNRHRAGFSGNQAESYGGVPGAAGAPVANQPGENAPASAPSGGDSGSQPASGSRPPAGQTAPPTSQVGPGTAPPTTQPPAGGPPGQSGRPSAQGQTGQPAQQSGQSQSSGQAPPSGAPSTGTGGGTASGSPGGVPGAGTGPRGANGTGTGSHTGAGPGGPAGGGRG